MIQRFIKIKLIPLYIIGLYLISAPFFQLPGLGLYDSKRLFQILLFGLLSVVFFIHSIGESTSKLKVSPLGLFPFICLLLSGVLSSVYSEYLRYGFIEIFNFLNIGLCVLILSQLNTKGQYYLGKFIFGIAVAFSLSYLIFFIGNYVAAYFNPLVPMWPERLAVAIEIGDTLQRGEDVLKFGNRRFFNHIQTWTLPLLVSLTIYFRSQKVYRNLIFLLLCFWWVLVFASGARGTTAAFIISCIFLVILFRKQSYRFIGTSIGTAIGGWVIYFLMFKAFTPDNSLPVIDAGDSARFEKWGKALELWSTSPVLGVGPMHYAAMGETGYAAHPHNFYLQLLAEWGVLGLACFLALVLFYLLFFKRTFLKKNFAFISLSERNTAVYMGFIGAAVAAFAHAGVSGIFHTPMSQIWAVLIFAWFISLWNRKGKSENNISIERKYLSIIYLMLVAALVYQISPDIGKLDREHKQFREQFENANISPRFWEQGLIFEREEERTENEEKETGSDSPGF